MGVNYPNVALTRTSKGGVDISLYRGEADKLLYQLKNLIRFNDLFQLKMTRLLSDGTVITAWSLKNPITGIYQDFVDIDTSKSSLLGVALAASCTITFVDLPISVPPMKDSGVILPTDVVGVNYFKTYYFADIKNCPTCQDIDWNFLLDYAVPVEPRHYDAEVDNHSVYSLEPPSWGEVIPDPANGKLNRIDAGGTYILWKTYTESGDNLSRTGLGIPLLRAIINQLDGTELCRQEQKFDVDCCKKDPSLRDVEIWWEDFGTCQPFLPYAGVLYNAICKIPTSIPFGGTAGLVWYACTHPYQPFYSIPEIKGSCLPVKWTLSGPIEFLGSKENDNLIRVKCLSSGCNDTASIMLEDRCGNFYSFVATPACPDADPLQINYTSLQMSCGGRQTFSTTGGCGTKIWSCQTGTIDQLGNYTAPATNENCANNDTVSVSDECGNNASCQIAVNCYQGVEPSMTYGVCDVSAGCYCVNQGCDQGFTACVNRQLWTYNCSGGLISFCESAPGGVFPNPPCNGETGGYTSHSCDPYFTCVDNCYSNTCGGPATCGLIDARSSGMKTGGCCPINPYTGLPLPT